MLRHCRCFSSAGGNPICSQLTKDFFTSIKFLYTVKTKGRGIYYILAMRNLYTTFEKRQHIHSTDLTLIDISTVSLRFFSVSRFITSRLSRESRYNAAKLTFTLCNHMYDFRFTIGNYFN